jgi:hypothetical protein
MNSMKKITVFLLVAALARPAMSQTDKSNLLGQLNTITTAVPFLMISPDARAGGMGDQGVSTGADASAIHWNPAKLAFAEKNIGFAVSYTPWLKALVNDIYLGYLSGYVHMSDDQAIGGSLRYFSLCNITFTDKE